MVVEKRPDAEPIRGYRLIERLGAGGFGEVWKCEAPGGIFKAIKFVYGSLNGLDNNSAHVEEELRAVQLIKSIRHPFLLSIDRVECINGELVIITELAERNLHELWEQHIAQGLPGIPRVELLGFLREVAEVLDLLNQKFDLQHLDIKPRNLFLFSNHVKVADFGLVNSLAGAVTERLQATMNSVTPVYAAPELFMGKLSRHCDQYSLAIVYQELLTGVLPFKGKNLRQLLLQHTQENPDLAPLSSADRTCVGRALAKKPEDRFASCLDFVRVLQAEPTPARGKPSSDFELSLGPPATMPDAALLRGKETMKIARIAGPVLPKNALADHHFLECVSNSPLMEVWITRTPDGTHRRLQLLYGLGGVEVGKLKEALARLQSLQHPALITPQIVHVESGRVILLTDSARESMRERFHQCQTRKQPGIPRGELVDYIRATAEVLDYLYQQHNVQHLNLNPRNLVLHNGWLQIAEFGYAQFLWLPAGQDIAKRNMRYAAPELFGPALSRHCDQYSLALIYAEMLTGSHPFQGLSPQMYLAKQTPANLERLPDLDQAVIRRALAFDPHERWGSCTEMLLALEGTSLHLNKDLQEKPDHFVQFVAAEQTEKRKAVDVGINPSDLQQIFIADLINAAGGNVTPMANAELTMNQDQEAVHCQFQAGLPLGAAKERLQGFSQKMFATMIRQDETTSTMHFELPTSFWQQWFGQHPKLELVVELVRVNPMSATPIDVKALLRALHCTKKRAVELLEKMSLDLLETLQQHIMVNSEKRSNDRLLWPHKITIIPIDRQGQREECIECRGKDLSQTGIGFYLPHELTTAELLIEIPNAQHPPKVTVPATLVRAKRCADGWYEVGAIFRLPSMRRSVSEVHL